MAYQELDVYVAEQIAQGLDAQTIKHALLTAGWLEVDVDNALRDVAARAIPKIVSSDHDELVRVHHALNALDQRVERLETNLVAAPEATLPSGQVPNLPSGTVSRDMGLAMPAKLTVRRAFMWVALAGVFVLIGYVGMASILQDSLTPVSRIWAEATIGLTLAAAGFISGKVRKRGAANILTGTGLAFVSLATVGAWYLNYMEWTVAAALGALLVTLALVLGRFYDTWAAKGPWRAHSV